jgi:hypothetical protein
VEGGGRDVREGKIARVGECKREWERERIIVTFRNR